ncbi:MAG TPA: fused MFS/spermidine synthase, partial [Egibacteraceae bacterium]|nr:fused MFS/spermidine synthase [Egibacteraceae bacterium]
MSAGAAGLLVFLASAAVLVLEILAGRVLAPFVGVTLETYTAVIGIVLAGIALGASWGGRVADRMDPRRIIGPLLAAGGALALLSVPIVLFLGPPLRGGGAASVLILTSAGFFLPAVALSAVAPAVVKLRLRDLDQTGHVVGRLSALGTAGALAGVFVTGFVLVALIPTRLIILAVGAALVAGGLLLHWRLKAGPAESPGQDVRAYAALGLVGALLTGVSQAPCDVESAYYCAEVVTDERDPTRRTLILDTLRHSAVDLDDPEYLEFHYMRWFAGVVDARWPGGRPLDALHVGGGGFAMPRWLEATRPGSDSLVLEIDPALVELNRRELGLRDSPGLDVRVGDARNAVRTLPQAAYDVVIGDAFGGLAVPWHLTTLEFAQRLRDLLRPGGVYVVNVIDGPPFDFARAELRTLHEVFAHVAVVAPRDRFDGRTGGNLVLVASDAPLPE